MTNRHVGVVVQVSERDVLQDRRGATGGRLRDAHAAGGGRRRRLAADGDGLVREVEQARGVEHDHVAERLSDDFAFDLELRATNPEAVGPRLVGRGATGQVRSDRPNLQVGTGLEKAGLRHRHLGRRVGTGRFGGRRGRGRWRLGGFRALGERRVQTLDVGRDLRQRARCRCITLLQRRFELRDPGVGAGDRVGDGRPIQAAIDCGLDCGAFLLGFGELAVELGALLVRVQGRRTDGAVQILT